MNKQDSIILRIERDTPIGLEELSLGMIAFAAEYERFIRREHPKAQDTEADLLVRRVDEGSIIIELVGAIQPLFNGMDNILIFKEFVNFIGLQFERLAAHKGRLEDPTTRELRDFTRMAETVAGDAAGNTEFTACEYISETAERKVQARVILKSKEASRIVENANSQLREITGGEPNRQNGVLMRLFQTNIGEATPDRSSGEKGIIEAITDAPRRLIYASEIAGQRIKGAWTDEGNPYDLGFVVDVDVQMINGRPRAYRIMEVHDVFPLDEQED